MSTVTIFGASDDLIEFRGAIDGEAGARWDDDSAVVLHSPSGETMVLLIGYCTANPDGWSICVESGTWPHRITPRPEYPEDQAIEIDVPVVGVQGAGGVQGTWAECDGERVR